jgi:hypothetical protein
MKNRDTEMPEEPFDPDEDNPAELDELDFSDDENPSFTTLSQEKDFGETDMGEDDFYSASINNSDNLEPDIIIKEDGTHSPYEFASNTAADAELTITNIEGIGAGHGLDEAELAEIDPLDEEDS